MKNTFFHYTQLALSGKKKWIHSLRLFLGPAFIASVAYVDPGNFASNIQSGAEFGYLFVWIILLANLWWAGIFVVTEESVKTLHGDEKVKNVHSSEKKALDNLEKRQEKLNAKKIKNSYGFVNTITTLLDRICSKEREVLKPH